MTAVSIILTPDQRRAAMRVSREQLFSISPRARARLAVACGTRAMHLRDRDAAWTLATRALLLGEKILGGTLDGQHGIEAERSMREAIMKFSEHFGGRLAGSTAISGAPLEAARQACHAVHSAIELETGTKPEREASLGVTIHAQQAIAAADLSFRDALRYRVLQQADVTKFESWLQTELDAAVDE